MTKVQRIRNILAGLALIVCALVLTLFPEYGYSFIAVVMSFSLTLYGVRMLVYYFTMARHMVGGRALLYTGAIIFALGVFIGSLADIPQLHIVVYLLVVHLVAGGLNVARGVEAKKAGAPLWRRSMGMGVANLFLCATCVAFFWAPEVVIYGYAIGLVGAACVRIASAFRRTAIVYIP